MRHRDREIDTDRFPILHEEVEKTLIDRLGLHYLHAHQIATRAEQAAVRADNIQWRAYDAFMQKYVKQIGDEKLEKLPPDLDLKPYRDEHDYDLLARMSKAMAKVEVKVDERKFAAATPDIQAALSDARTVKPGKATYTFKKLDEQEAA